MPEAMTSKPGPTLDQRRANHAWEAIQRILKEYPVRIVNENGKQKKVPHEQAKRYGGQAKKLPTRIMAAGLGQALAFLQAKDYAPDLLVAISDWVLIKRPKPDDKTGPPLAKEEANLKKSLIEGIVKGDSNFLRRATDEVLAYLVWLNRFAEAEGLTEGEEG
jgi:CRISPR-associated protein Cmr5